jgi:signal transduction histidine kinase/CheY-like chemotaxis protein
MNTTKNQSIATKLTWMNLLVSGAALLLACTAFIGYDLITYRNATVRSLSTQARIIGLNTVSALLFDDPHTGEETLSALREYPGILSAIIYRNDGQVFASWSPVVRDAELQRPAFPAGATETHWIANGQIALVRPILVDGKPIGYVYLRSGVQELQQRFTLYVGIAAVVLLISLLAALIFSSIFRRAVAAPIVSLAETAQMVSRKKDYSIRVGQRGGHNELTTLVNSFNEMLCQIEQREDALQHARDDLERRVQERTAELVTAKKELEEYSSSVLRAKEEVERTSKFKDQFLSTMSHELRTPLNAVLGFSEMLSAERYGPLNDRQHRYVTHIHTGGKHLLRLINDILDISKIEAGRLQLTIETVPVDTTFAEVVDALQPLIDKRSQTLIQDSASQMSVLADSVRFRQILMNLLGNAIKFTPDAGRIELKARQEGTAIRIEVRDSGPGIPLEEQGRIFEAFHRLRHADKAAEGTGLGLAITRSLVELHGGKLGLESEPGSGSCFYFTLPAAAAVAKAEFPFDVATDNGCSPGRILVVDDDHAAAQLLESQLSSVGYEVILCDQPARAVEMAATLQPAAVTLDIVMKPLNGWEVLSNLKADPRTRHVPVVVVTIIDQKSTGALLGADEYIVKPVDRAALLSAVERCLRQRRQEGKSHSILVVEDDPPTREFISEVLCRQGYEVSVAANGIEAHAQLRAALPDAVVLDLILPDVSGLRLLAEWRGDPRTADLPVLVLTSKDLTAAEKSYLRKNAEAFFSKQEDWETSLVRSMLRAAPLPVPVETP